ncbi:MAG: hypothetical protein AB1847_05950 [bacterium]
MHHTIKLGKNEKIIPLRVSYEIVGSGRVDSDEIESEDVAGSIVFFTRVVDGIEILGGGSVIAVLFASDLTPIGFDFDWSSYNTTNKVQEIAGLSEVYGRVSALSTLKNEADKIEFKRVDFGYYDPGVRDRDPMAYVQPSVAIDYVAEFGAKNDEKDPDLQEETYTTAAYVDYIPIGRTVEEDTMWPQAIQLRNEGDQSVDSKLSHALPLDRLIQGLGIED